MQAEVLHCTKTFVWIGEYIYDQLVEAANSIQFVQFQSAFFSAVFFTDAAQKPSMRHAAEDV